MTLPHSPIRIAFLAALMHAVVGNVIGAYTNGLCVLEYVFMPYTFIAGMSAFAGWDLLSFFLEVGALGLMTLIFCPLGLFLHKTKAEAK